MKAEFGEIVRTLTTSGVNFIVIGGVAGNLLGAARITYDLDLRDLERDRADG